MTGSTRGYARDRESGDWIGQRRPGAAGSAPADGPG